MNAWLAARAANLARAWTRVYTWRLPAAVRDARRAEIESDLWEFQRDATAAREINVAMQIAARLLLGMADDIAWRRAQPRARRMSRPLALTLLAVCAAALFAGTWMFSVMLPDELPVPPNMMKFVAAPPPSPPD
jgi:hypothetical protein